MSEDALYFDCLHVINSAIPHCPTCDANWVAMPNTMQKRRSPLVQSEFDRFLVGLSGTWSDNVFCVEGDANIELVSFETFEDSWWGYSLKLKCAVNPLKFSAMFCEHDITHTEIGFCQVASDTIANAVKLVLDMGFTHETFKEKNLPKVQKAFPGLIWESSNENARVPAATSGKWECYPVRMHKWYLCYPGIETIVGHNPEDCAANLREELSLMGSLFGDLKSLFGTEWT